MNVSNRTLFIADNLPILRGIDSDCIDLIYLDPPFNTNRNYKAPIGSPAEGAEFKDIWRDVDIEHQWHGEIAETNEELYQIVQASEVIYDKSMKIYLMAMAVRLFEMHRILKPTGSLYLHCDPTASHYLKLVMDSLFGNKNFQSEVVWGYRTQGVSMSSWPKKHDILLHYGRSQKPTFHPQRQRLIYEKPFRHTKVDDQGRHYADVYVRDVWDDDPETKALISQAKERTGYPTQKPLALLRRIIKASSNEGDMILDPFCGCATACVAAEQLQRQWIGIDISPSAEDITKIRLEEASEQGILFSSIQMSDVTVTSTSPLRTDESGTAVQRRLPSAYEHKHELYGLQEGHCNGCKLHFRIRNLTIDHIIPESKGGTDHRENLQLLCGACNSTKGNRSQEYLYQQLEQQEALLREKIRVVSTPRVA